MSIQVSGYDLTNFDEFVKACRAVLGFYGSPGGRDGSAMYMIDGGLTLVTDEGKDLLVRCTFRRATGKPLINPVISIDAAGKVIREHGEWVYARERLAIYLQRMQNNFHDQKKIKQITLDEFSHSTLYSHYILEG